MIDIRILIFPNIQLTMENPRWPSNVKSNSHSMGIKEKQGQARSAAHGASQHIEAERTGERL